MCDADNSLSSNSSIGMPSFSACFAMCGYAITRNNSSTVSAEKHKTTLFLFTRSKSGSKDLPQSSMETITLVSATTRIPITTQLLPRERFLHCGLAHLLSERTQCLDLGIAENSFRRSYFCNR